MKMDYNFKASTCFKEGDRLINPLSDDRIKGAVSNNFAIGQLSGGLTVGRI